MPVGSANDGLLLPDAGATTAPLRASADERFDAILMSGEEMVALRSEDSDEEFIQYLKKFEDPGAFIDFHTIGQPAWKLGEPPKKRKGKRKKKQVDPGGFINVPWNL